MRALATGCIVAALAAGLVGCVYHTEPVVPQPKLTGAGRNFQAVWRATLEVLRRYDFEIDRQDRRAGVITTRPLLGKHFFEFWRRDAADPRDVAESTLQTIYRTVTVTIRPTSAGAATFRPDVEVRLRRSNRQYVGVASTTDAYDMFILPGRDELREKKIMAGGRRRDLYQEPKPVRRVKLGPYKTLAHKLAAEIRQAARKRLAGWK